MGVDNVLVDVPVTFKVVVIDSGVVPVMDSVSVLLSVCVVVVDSDIDNVMVEAVCVSVLV